MREDVQIPLERHDDGGFSVPAESGLNSERSLGELFKQLSTDTAELVKQEAMLAKAEIATSISGMAHDATKLGIAAGLALAGVLALTAFAVVGLGTLLANYWLSSLIVGVVLFAVGGAMAKSAIAGVKHRGVVPKQTLATLQADASWTEQQAHQLKRDLTAKGTNTAATQNDRR